LGLRGAVGEECCADAASYGDHAGSVWRDVFDGGEREVEGGGGSGVLPCPGGLVPLVGIDIAVGSACVVAAAGAGRQSSDADDSALDGAAESVGVSEQYGLRRWDGLELRGPEAGGDPESCDGKHGEAEGSLQSEEGERYEDENGEEEKDSGARGLRRNLGEGLAEGETEGGGEQRGTTEAEWLDAREPGPETALALVL